MTVESSLADVRNRLNYLTQRALIRDSTSFAEAQAALDSLDAADRELTALSIRIAGQAALQRLAAPGTALRIVMTECADLLEQAISLAAYPQDEIERVVSESTVQPIIDRLRAAAVS